ncbi:WEB family protein At3g02930, chloroplastic isoform X2 [Pieris rapae]|uniref:WEB family protein At3g02930, chloroplastic isoform X2 n=1 Tax=Pieris rapae TaxID=64459 RepID=UPI001E27F441|nr:WEB family protein At3g02930, chloroplastic isoform X2 [Pieris rapae]
MTQVNRHLQFQCKTEESKINTPARTSISNMLPTPKGVENAKKRLRAFSIQKKTPITPIVAPKPAGSGNTTVLIGKLSGIKPTLKREEDPDPKVPKLPKPPKPGSERKAWQDTYSELQRRTQAEIEDMKRKMELVDLGIPLGLICPSSTSDTAMPTKAMPPIKSFIDPSKVDELIREAKKAKLEGKPFKFDYRKLLPDYDNPFQRKKDEKDEKDKKHSRRKSDLKDRKDKYGSRRYSDHRKDNKVKERTKDRKQKVLEVASKKVELNAKEDVHFGDFVVCDSWSLDNEDTNISSPKTDKSDSQSSALERKNYKEPSELLRASAAKKNEIIKRVTTDNRIKIQPIVDTFKFETDDNNEDVLNIFDAETNIDKFATARSTKLSLYDSPNKKSIDLDDTSRDLSLDDTFLESVINEIKVEELNEDDSQDKGLVEYESPNNDDTPNTSVSESVTPEIVEKEKKHEYCDGYRSSESGYKTSDTAESYKSGIEFRLSIEKELDDALNADKMSKVNLDSLEAWTFVLKICQPLLFRHDKNQCYKETQSTPKLWYSTNPKLCSCVKERDVVYEELENNKMNLVDRVYGCDQISEVTASKCRNWYPSGNNCLVESKLQLSSEWEADDSQQSLGEERRSLTPKTEELDLDREYHRFMEAVWPDVIETKKETSGSTTPVQENRKKRKEDNDTREEEKRTKKMKLSSEGWSQESEVEEDDRSKKKNEKAKSRKRKHSTSISSSSDSEEDSRKKNKALKKKAMKKAKSKSAKRRRIGRKLLKKLKEKQKKSKKKIENDSDSVKSKKSKKRKSVKDKKKDKKRKKTKKVSSSSSSSSSSDSESERKSSKKNREKNRKGRKASSETQNEIMVDANILNNIKTEKTTDDEESKLMEFSPRRQKPREIINVKELQNDFVGNTHVKEEIEEKIEKVRNDKEKEAEAVEESKSPIVESKKSECGLKDDSDDADPEASIIYEVGDKQESPIESEVQPTEPVKPDENSQSSSQASVYSAKNEDSKSTDVQDYEKDESHLRPPSQNSNYSFKDVMDASGYKEEKFESYEPAEYDVCEQMAMAYQSDVAGQAGSPIDTSVSRIETVVRVRSCGEITCDWRPGHDPADPIPHRPSRWGLKPGEVNIVLTGGDTRPVYKIQSLANRNENNTPISYDEAYMDTYGASDRLQYGDCFASEIPKPDTAVPVEGQEDKRSTLDDRISQALRETVLGDVAKELPGEERGTSEKTGTGEPRLPSKRVRFADGYTPGQDSDTEPPPAKKRRVRRSGCAWPCPSTHPDHVSLWDALPPPPPPPGDPPPRRMRPRVPEALLGGRMGVGVGVGGFMPPEPPPGLIALH